MKDENERFLDLHVKMLTRICLIQKTENWKIDKSWNENEEKIKWQKKWTN